MKLSQNRQKLAVELVNHPFQGVLDLGCGKEKLLKKYLKNTRYLGVDFVGVEGIKSWDLEKGLTFLEDKSFDVIFAIEVLEHLENIHFLCKEMQRVAVNEIVIALPNMNHWIYRLRHLFGKPIFKKYDFFKQKTDDRHRWFTTHRASREFIVANFPNAKINEAGAIYPYQRKRFLRKVDNLLSRVSPEAFVYTSLFHIDLT